MSSHYRKRNGEATAGSLSVHIQVAESASDGGTPERIQNLVGECESFLRQFRVRSLNVSPDLLLEVLQFLQCLLEFVAIKFRA